MTFTRERTGTRTFDLNTDGVAHYGLMADLLADTERGVRRPPGAVAAVQLGRGYLEMWERAVRHR